jgi:hypothetical protein
MPKSAEGVETTFAFPDNPKLRMTSGEEVCVALLHSLIRPLLHFLQLCITEEEDDEDEANSFLHGLITFTKLSIQTKPVVLDKSASQMCLISET